MKIKQEPEEINSELISREELPIQIKEEDNLISLAQVANAYNITLDWKYEILNDGFLCSIFFNNYKIGTVKGPNQEAAKKKAVDVALYELQKVCYKIDFTEDIHWVPKLSQNEAPVNDSNNNFTPIGSDNIGMRMLKSMGWSGGGLGKNSQGITEPVNLEQQKTRKGFGFKPDNTMKVCPPVKAEIAATTCVKAPSHPAETHRIKQKKKKKKKDRLRKMTAKKMLKLQKLTLQEQKVIKPAQMIQPMSSSGGGSQSTEAYFPTVGHIHATSFLEHSENVPQQVQTNQSSHEIPVVSSTPLENFENVLDEAPMDLPTNEASTSAQFANTNKDTLAATSELKIALVPERYPEERLTADQSQLLLKALIVAILDVAEGSYVPRFRNNWLLRGAQIFHCDSLEDKKWLLCSAPGLLPWPGAKLRLMDQSALQKVERLTICVRGEHAADVILKCLAKQNDALRVHEWTVVRSWQARDEARGVVETAVRVLMEESQVEALQALGFRPFCAAGKAYILHHEKNSTENDGRQEQEATPAGDDLCIGSA